VHPRLSSQSLELEVIQLSSFGFFFFCIYNHHLMWILLVWLTVRSQVSITFNLCIISNLLVSTRYHRGLSLAQWFHNPWFLGWRFSNHTCVWMKRGHLNSHEGLLYLITGSSMLVTVNWVPWLFTTTWALLLVTCSVTKCWSVYSPSSKWNVHALLLWNFLNFGLKKESWCLLPNGL